MITVRNEVAKVRFLHVCVCPRGITLAGTPLGTRYTPPEPGTPPRRQLLLWTVQILLECILVQ